MRSGPVRAIAGFLCILLFNAPLAPVARAADDESFGITILKAAGSSAAGKGAEFAVKALGGLVFNAACKDKVLEPGDQYMCDVLGSVTGKSEEEWKKKVEKQLGEINDKLGDLQKSQTAIQYELKQQHEAMTNGFNQAAAKVEATHAIVRIENLWEKYEAQFDGVDNDLKRDTMIAFAKDIIANNLHTKLGDLNVVLTKSTLDGQPLLRYPMYEWRMKQRNSPPEAYNAVDIYDFAEKKFVDFRIQQHKVYVMYLWAAAVLESDCKLHPGQCVKPPRSTADFNADYDRYTRQQLETFNAATDWLLLSYTLVHNENPRTLPISTVNEEVLLRANFLTASTLSSGEGLWGRIISMGKTWDGSLEVGCNNAMQTVKPVMKYSVPVDDREGVHPLDWWVSRSGNLVYDEVHFANEYTDYLYQLPKAGIGPCRVNATLPNRAGMLPWAQGSSQVVQVKTADGRSFPFGSFLAVQRAGGTYALASGNWKRATDPLRKEDGKGQRENVRWDWTITTSRANGAPWMSLLNEGDGEWKIANGTSRVHNWNQIYFYNDKKIYFPEGGKVKLYLLQHNDCAKVCRGNDGSDSVVMNYDVWNNDTDSKKGWMKATAAIFLDPRTSDPNALSSDLRDRPIMGIKIDGSYDKTGDQKTKNVSGDQNATFTPRTDTGYHLQYLIDFEVETEGRFTNKTHWMYRAKLTPSWLYVTR